MNTIRLLHQQVHVDSRGLFMETFNSRDHRQRWGVKTNWVQDNVSLTNRKGTIRGLHLQYPRSQDKLVYVLQGQVFDVVADVRVGSHTFGQYRGFQLSPGDQLYIPAGFAHGFQTLTDNVIFAYKCSEFYAPKYERTIRWSDPTLNVNWPLGVTEISAADSDALELMSYGTADLPHFNRNESCPII